MGATIAPVTGVTGATGGIGRCFIEQQLREPVGEIWAVARTAQRQPPPRTEPSSGIAPIRANLSCPAALPAPGQRLQAQSPVVKDLINHAGGGNIALFISFTAAEIQPSISPASPSAARPQRPCAACACPICKQHICSRQPHRQYKPYRGLTGLILAGRISVLLHAADKASVRANFRVLQAEPRRAVTTVTTVCLGWVRTDLPERERGGRPIHFPGLAGPVPVVQRAGIYLPVGPM